MIPGWAAMGAGLHALFAAHATAITGLVIFLEELGIPIPVPGDLLMLLAGIQVAHGHAALWAVLLVEEIATVAGATILFLLSRRFGRALVTRYGRFVHLGPRTLATAEERVARHGAKAIVVARLVPGLRIVTVVAAGALNVRARVFVPALALGGFLYLLVYTLLGVFVGPLVLGFLECLALPVTALLSLAILALLMVIFRGFEREFPRTGDARRVGIGAALLSGLFGGVAALLVANGALGIVSFCAQVLGHHVPIAATQVTNELRLLFGWPVFLAAAVALGAAVAFLRTQPLPWPVRLLIVAGVPLALTLLLVDPLTEDVQLAGSSSGVITAVAVIRWLIFGVAVERLAPLINRVRQPAAAGVERCSDAA